MMYLIIKKIEADNVEQAIKKSEKEKIYNCTILPEDKIYPKDAVGFDCNLEEDD